MKSHLLLIAAAIALSACANPVSRKIATAYTEGCYGFQVIGKWPQAQRACERAALNAENGGLPGREIAPLWFEYGRVSGILCDYQQADLGLRQALELETAINGPVHEIQLELARLKSVTGEIAESAAWYEAFWASAPADLASRDPELARAIYEEMADAYLQLGDEAAADTAHRQLESLNSASAGFTLNNATPYGSVCY